MGYANTLNAGWRVNDTHPRAMSWSDALRLAPPTGRPLRVLSLKELLMGGMRALVQPHRAYQQLPADARVRTWLLLPLMALWGVPYAHLHFRFMEGAWMMTHGTQDEHFWRVMTFVVASAANWSIAAAALALVSWARRWPLSIAQCKIAAFYLWLVWALMPLIDTVHLLGISRVNVSLPGFHHVYFIWHASWMVAFPLIMVQLFCLFRFGFRCSTVQSMLAMAALVFLSRVGLETLSLRTVDRLAREGWNATMWQANTFHAAVGLGQSWCELLWLGRPRWWSTILYGGAIIIGVWLLCW